MCMKYILQEKGFFQDFMVEDLEEYVARKSRDGVWGDDIEIEALSEIYSRPIEIYAMDIKPIRTFHEDNPQNVEPMRLAYIGSCHYNSIKRRNQEAAALLSSKFG
jgi:OTU domain-containing protein 5